MKDSGIEWIGQIPQNWEVVRIGNLYSQRNIKVSDKDYPPLSVTMKGILPQIETAAKTNDGDNRKLVKKGDFAINSRSDRRGSCGISEFDGSVSLINIVLQPNQNMVPKYFDWLFHTTLFADEFYRFGNGIVDDLWSTRWDNMKKISIPFPPIDEQRKISEFLDKKCAKIDDLRKGIKEKIANLKAYKSSLITKAVTGKLAISNEKLAMKDSGISWIGEIPQNWEVKKVKYFADALFKGNGITKEQVSADGDIPCIRYGEIYSKYDNSFSECFSYTFEKSINSRQYCYYGDILIAGTGELIEEIGKNIVYLGQKPCLVGGDILVLQTSQDPKFINYALDCEYARNQKSCGKAKLKVVHISSFEIANLYIALPPLEEQKRISEFLDNKCKIIDDFIANLNRQDEVLREYKKSLIYECVTGKLAMSNE